MPSFDVVSKVDHHELTNAVDQANREITTRFDFKDSGAQFELKQNSVLLTAPSDFQVQQMQDILRNKLTKRSIDVRCLEFGNIEKNLSEARQTVTVKQGIEKELGKKITKALKNSQLKVQAAIQGEQVRVTGKSRDDLQSAIALLREEKLEQPLQFDNFRD